LSAVASTGESLIRITGRFAFNSVKSGRFANGLSYRSDKPGLAQDTTLLKRAYAPAKLSMKYHPFYQGKIEIVSKVPVDSYDDFAIWYTPGVADPCKEIQRSPDKVYDYTNKWNSIAIVTDGSRVLGLGDIGPEAGLPVMEGKSLLFKYLGGVDAYPICLGTKKPEEIENAVRWLQPSFGGINLEDISQPKCFDILDALKQDLRIPVWHDDQQGTGTVVCAGLINALKVVGKKIGNASICMLGAGAANIAVARIIIEAGVSPGNIIMVDHTGILNRQRTELEKEYHAKWQMCLKTNSEGRTGGFSEALKGADVLIAMSTPGPGVVPKGLISTMADDAIIFACANPIPEVWPWEAKEAGAKIVATGRSDFPNQVNNSLGFPGIFRGTLDVRAKMISDEMCIAAANELAKIAEEMGIDEDKILPSMSHWEVFPREAAAVGAEAVRQGLARLKLTRKELYERATTIITHARKSTELLMRKGLIKPLPGKSVGRRTKRRIAR
jgi:malate dehydrogenase (oxaloacetate-decarboxylating)